MGVAFSSDTYWAVGAVGAEGVVPGIYNGNTGGKRDIFPLQLSWIATAVPFLWRLQGMSRAGRKSSIEEMILNVRFHDLRQSCAARLVQNGVDLYKVQKLMRNKSLHVTPTRIDEGLRGGVEVNLFSY